jgi:hypothetical protein
MISFREFLIAESYCEPISDMSLKQLERLGDMMLNKFGIDLRFTTHFKDRMSDDRNNPCIMIDELKDIFRKIEKDQGEKIKRFPNAEVVIKDLQKSLNLPVVINYSKVKGFEIVAKTIMRKKNFKTPDKTVSV